jgi:hypothetical protein
MATATYHGPGDVAGEKYLVACPRVIEPAGAWSREMGIC